MNMEVKAGPDPGCMISWKADQHLASGSGPVFGLSGSSWSGCAKSPFSSLT